MGKRKRDQSFVEEASERWEFGLHKLILGHVATEQDLLDRYEKVATASGSAELRFVAGLIAEDEKRHHAWMADLLRVLQAKDDLYEEEAPIPELEPSDDRAEILWMTRHLLRAERDDGRDLKVLARRLEPVRHTTLWHLLVIMMLKDTQKHQLMLRFLRDRAREAKTTLGERS